LLYFAEVLIIDAHRQNKMTSFIEHVKSWTESESDVATGVLGTPIQHLHVVAWVLLGGMLAPHVPPAP
jgi:hypothetical protein